MNHLTRLFVILALSFIPSFSAKAVEINLSEPGTLADKVLLPRFETTLVLKGNINAVDLSYIAKKMTALTSLDLSQAAISACEMTVDGVISNYPEGFIPDRIFAGSKIETVILPKNSDITVGELAFAYSALKKISLGKNTKAVRMGAFSACPGLVSVSFNGASAFGSHVFSSCPNLSTVTIADADSIAASTFDSCTSLYSVIGDSDLRKIGDRAFAGCSALTSFSFSDRLVSIGEYAFSSTGLTDVDLSKCSLLASIGDWAFAHCSSLENVELPDNLKNIGEGIFFDCTSLAGIKLPGKLDAIGNYALKGISVAQLSLPSTLGSIGDLAMSGTDNLKDIDASKIAVVPTLGQDVWDTLNKSNVTLHVPTELSSQFASTPQWQDFEIVTKATNVDSDAITDGAIKISASFDSSDLIVKSTGTDLRTVNIFDTDGRHILSVAPDADQVRIPLNRLTRHIIIIEVYTTDSLHAVLKLVRQ